MSTKWLLLKKYACKNPMLAVLPHGSWSLKDLVLEHSAEQETNLFFWILTSSYRWLLRFNQHMYGLKILLCIIFKHQLITNYPYSFSLP